MDVLWVQDSAVTVREVRAALALQQERALAYTTVLTVLDNLHRKDWVRREMAGRAFRYWPARSQEEATANAVRTLLESTQNPAAVLLHFARTASESESAVLRAALLDEGGQSK